MIRWVRVKLNSLEYWSCSIQDYNQSCLALIAYINGNKWSVGCYIDLLIDQSELLMEIILLSNYKCWI